MLRRILITLGALIVLLPYSGFPHSWQTIMLTVIGAGIILLVFFSRPRGRHATEERRSETPHTLHVERREIEDEPEVHTERETTIDAERLEETPNSETVVEKKVTVVRRRRLLSGVDLLTEGKGDDRS